MVLIDTNVLAYLLIEGDRTKEAQALLSKDGDWHSDEFALVEFTNVLATTIRLRGLSRAAAADVLASAEDLLQAGLHSVPHAETLAVAAQRSVSAYDARFLALASRLGVPLVTEDARLRAAAPELTWSIAEALA